jgi:two-component system, response regulator YesN
MHQRLRFIEKPVSKLWQRAASGLPLLQSLSPPPPGWYNNVLHKYFSPQGVIGMTAGELCRVLIVDDELLIRQGIKHYIHWEQEGFEVAGEASNGQEALQLIETAKPHIILTDIVMPIMDGEELTRIVKERYPEIEIIILSSFGEFDYVRSAFQSGVVDYILKPKLDAQGLLNVLKKAAGRIPEFQQNNQHNGAQPLSSMIEKAIAGYEVDLRQEGLAESLPYRHFCLLAVSGTEEQAAKIRESVEASNHEAVCIPFQGRKDVNCFLIHTSKQQLQALPGFAQHLAGDENTTLALGPEFTQLSNIKEAYSELLQLLNVSFYLPDRRVLIKSDLPPLPPKTESFNLDYFTDEMKRKNFDSAFSYLETHAAAMSIQYHTEVFEFKAFFGNIIFNITILLNNMGYEVKELEKRKHAYFHAIEEAKTAADVIKQLSEFIAQAKNCIYSTANQPDNTNLKKVMDYIREHYAEPLTLTEVAKHFHFNPSYLSSYFSTHNQESFVEYVNRVRIEEASRLLVHDTTPISEISGSVGFSDHSYFCKVFKKSTGLSPSQYRRKQPR